MGGLQGAFEEIQVLHLPTNNITASPWTCKGWLWSLTGVQCQQRHHQQACVWQDVLLEGRQDTVMNQFPECLWRVHLWLRTWDIVGQVGFFKNKSNLKKFFCCSVTQSCLTLCNPTPYTGFPLLHHLPECAQTHVIESVMPSKHLILCPLLLLPSIFPSIRVFSNELALCIRWPEYWPGI